MLTLCLALRCSTFVTSLKTFPAFFNQLFFQHLAAATAVAFIQDHIVLHLSYSGVLFCCAVLCQHPVFVAIPYKLCLFHMNVFVNILANPELTCYIHTQFGVIKRTTVIVNA